MLERIRNDVRYAQDVAGKAGGGASLVLAALFGLMGIAGAPLVPVLVATFAGLAACAALVVISVLPTRWLAKK
ncbi:hypothetical protein ACIQUY_05010 [Streptomyces sp. NPDC090231]|uniref:hypothetical protein n=1 Tax=unclassified Streptomyces TaxID=2593676 RepID=UPI00383073A8